MSFLPALFTVVLQIFLLAWSMIHPEVSASHRRVSAFARAIDSDYQRWRPGHTVYASTRVTDTGYWHTSGNLILNHQGRAVRIQGINWYGFETVRKVPGGLNVQDYRVILDTILSEGFNTVRIPFSNEMVEDPIVPGTIAFVNDHGQPINQPLSGLNSIEILDRIVEHAGRIGLKVVLDNHRSEAGNSAEDNGLWYTAAYPERSWVADWQMLARRYAGNSTVIGMDLRNEPHNAASGGACWSGCGPAHDWHLAAERAGDAVLAINPRLIIFVEGTDSIGSDWYWWGGNLEGVRFAPVHLNVPNQLVYSAHEYGPQQYAQRWFTGASAASLMAVFDRHWGFVSRNRIAPVWIGEFGTSNRSEDITGTASGTEGQWFQALISYFASNHDVSWASWALNGEDADGLLDASYTAPVNSLKLAALSRIMDSTAPQAALPVQRFVHMNVAAAGQTPARTSPAHTSNGQTRTAGAARAYRPHLPASTLRGVSGDGGAEPLLPSQVSAEADGN